LPRAHAKRWRSLPRGVRADPFAAEGYGVRRARARLPALPARTLRRVQPGLRPRYAVRAAIARPHRSDPAFDAAARAVALRMDAGERHARGGLVRRVPHRKGLVA